VTLLLLLLRLLHRWAVFGSRRRNRSGRRHRLLPGPTRPPLGNRLPVRTQLLLHRCQKRRRRRHRLLPGPTRPPLGNRLPVGTQLLQLLLLLRLGLWPLRRRLCAPAPAGREPPLRQRGAPAAPLPPQDVHRVGPRRRRALAAAAARQQRGQVPHRRRPARGARRRGGLAEPRKLRGPVARVLGGAGGDLGLLLLLIGVDVPVEGRDELIEYGVLLKGRVMSCYWVVA
jgi:hypothetical protein